MSVLAKSYWTGPRILALGIVTLVMAIFIAANIHLVAVSLASRPDCVLQPDTEGVAALRAAKPSC